MVLSRENETSAAGQFLTTHWSVVLTAGRSSSPGSQQALTTLCETYWYPLYVYARRRGHADGEARDLCQEFFVRLLEGDILRAADPERGKFRSFLLASLKNFLSNERRDARAKKRGGDRVHRSLDFQSAEERYRLEPVDHRTPEAIYERRWAMTLLERALSRLRNEYTKPEKADLFDRLKGFLGAGEGKTSYKEVAEQTGMTEGAVKVWVHRLRRRFRDLLREEIAQTVAGLEDIDDELSYLLSVLGR